MTRSVKVLTTIAALLLLIGCRSVPPPVVSGEKSAAATTSRAMVADTVRVVDTVRVTEHGDTVWVEKIKWRERLRVRVDTFTSERVDTVLVTATKVEKSRARHSWGEWVIPVLTLIAAILILLKK